MSPEPVMHAHVLQHVPFESLGCIDTWLRARGADVGFTRLWAGDPLPSLDGLDLLIAMGGPMSVNDEDAFPWLRVEKVTLRDAIDRGTRVLGVCLGAQLIASALGARHVPSQLRICWTCPTPGSGTRPDERTGSSRSGRSSRRHRRPGYGSPTSTSPAQNVGCSGKAKRPAGESTVIRPPRRARSSASWADRSAAALVPPRVRSR